MALGTKEDGCIIIIIIYSQAIIQSKLEVHEFASENKTKGLELHRDLSEIKCSENSCSEFLPSPIY